MVPDKIILFLFVFCNKRSRKRLDVKHTVRPTYTCFPCQTVVLSVLFLSICLIVFQISLSYFWFRSICLCSFFRFCTWLVEAT